MNHKDLPEFFFENNLRIDRIIWLGACACCHSDDLESFFEDEPEKAEQLLGQAPPPSYQQYEDFISDLSRSGKSGYVVKASTPVKEDGCFSWGHTTGEWFYFELWDEANVANTILRWAEKFEATE